MQIYTRIVRVEKYMVQWVKWDMLRYFEDGSVCVAWLQIGRAPGLASGYWVNWDSQSHGFGHKQDSHH